MSPLSTFTETPLHRKLRGIVFHTLLSSLTHIVQSSLNQNPQRALLNPLIPLLLPLPLPTIPSTHIRTPHIDVAIPSRCNTASPALGPQLHQVLNPPLLTLHQKPLEQYAQEDSGQNRREEDQEREVRFVHVGIPDAQVGWELFYGVLVIFGE